MAAEENSRTPNTGRLWSVALLMIFVGAILIRDGMSGEGYADQHGYLTPDQSFVAGAFAVLAGGYAMYQAALGGRRANTEGSTERREDRDPDDGE
jgi:hypothetical protein